MAIPLVNGSGELLFNSLGQLLCQPATGQAFADGTFWADGTGWRE